MSIRTLLAAVVAMAVVVAVFLALQANRPPVVYASVAKRQGVEKLRNF
jgi:anti-sigma-K factor RskA